MAATKGNVEVMDRFIQVMDPKASRESRWALAIVAVRLGLHPLNNEVMLYEGQPFITIHGRRRLAERNGDLAAIQPDIVTDPQRRRALGARSDGDIVGECRVFRKSDERPTIQYAIVRSSERWPSDREAEALGVPRADLDKLRANDNPDGLFLKITNPRAKVRPVIMFPEQMAMKRAEARALDSLAGVPLPTYDAEIGGPITNGAIPAYMLETAPEPDQAPGAGYPGQSEVLPPEPPPPAEPEPAPVPPADIEDPEPAGEPPARMPAQAEFPAPCLNDARTCGCAQHRAERNARRA